MNSPFEAKELAEPVSWMWAEEHGWKYDKLQASAPTIPQALRKLGKLSTYCTETDYQVSQVTKMLNDPLVVTAGLGWVWYKILERPEAEAVQGRPSCAESRTHEGQWTVITDRWGTSPAFPSRPQGSPASAEKT